MMGWEDMKGNYLLLMTESLDDLFDHLRKELSEYLSDKVTDEIIRKLRTSFWGHLLIYLSTASEDEEEALERYRGLVERMKERGVSKPKPFLVKLIEVMK